MEDNQTMSENESSEENDIEVEHNPMPQESPEESDETFETATKIGDWNEADSLKNRSTVSQMQMRMSQRADDFKERASVSTMLLPRVNCTEKIIICLDLSSEMDCTPFKLGDGSKFAPLAMTKRIIEIFVHSKNFIGKNHEFALVAFYESAVWIKDFVSDPKEFCSALEDVNETKQCERLCLSTLFDVIAEKITLPEIDNPEVLPPPFTVRTILLYGRSQCIPEFTYGKESWKHLLQSGYFFLDIFYIHELPGEDNKCEEIFEVLCDLDERGTSYIFEVSRNTTRLHDCMAKFLSHPLQRPSQKDTYYKIGLTDELDG